MKNVRYKRAAGKWLPPESEHNRLGRLAGLLLAVLCCAGCGGPMYTKPLEREPATQAERNFRDLWRASLQVLKKHGFRLDRQDRRGGTITTYAVSGGHGLEALWRKDAASGFYFQENTAQNILRAARVRIHRVPDRPDEFDFKVEVLMARTNRPQPQVTNAVEVPRMTVRRLPNLRFSDLQPPPPSFRGKHEGVKANIVPLGSDEALAARIDAKIRGATGLREESIPPEPSAPAEKTLTDHTPPPVGMPARSTRRVILAGPLDDPEKIIAVSQPASQPANAKDTPARTPQAMQGQEKDGLVCSLETRGNPDDLTTPVTMRFRLRNTGNATIHLPQPKHGMTLFGRYRKVGESRWNGAPPEGFELPKVATLAAGETLEVPVHFGFGSAGKYEIYFRYSARQGRDTNWTGDLDSNTLKLTITGAK